ncbi:hypothetical protein L218DRAFT_955034 [Marasmius fiardii PR-910]|nr:hypothetical protein L218DRAFT_955034 [Marasmius fiardii PR-910]
MTIVHIVQFSFKSTATSEQINEVCQAFLALKEKCVKPDTQEPYLKLVTGGRDNSPEGLQGGMTHAFVVDLETEEDRRYYLNHDPAHREFGKLASSIIQSATVVDFEPGTF